MKEISELIGHELWFHLLQIACKRYKFAVKNSYKNVLPLHIEYMVLGELRGIRWLLTDLHRENMISESKELLRELNALIELQDIRCKTMYKER